MDLAEIQNRIDKVFAEKPNPSEIAQAIINVGAKLKLQEQLDGFKKVINDDYYARLIAEQIVQNRFSAMTFDLFAKKMSAAKANAQNPQVNLNTGTVESQVPFATIMEVNIYA